MVMSLWGSRSVLAPFLGVRDLGFLLLVLKRMNGWQMSEYVKLGKSDMVPYAPICTLVATVSVSFEYWEGRSSYLDVI